MAVTNGQDRVRPDRKTLGITRKWITKWKREARLETRTRVHDINTSDIPQILHLRNGTDEVKYHAYYWVHSFWTTTTITIILYYDWCLMSRMLYTVPETHTSTHNTQRIPNKIPRWNNLILSALHFILGLTPYIHHCCCKWLL